MQPTLPLPATPQKPALPVVPAPSAAVPERFNTTLDAATADQGPHLPPRTNDVDAAQDQPATSADADQQPLGNESIRPAGEQEDVPQADTPVDAQAVVSVPVVQPVDQRPLQAGLNPASSTQAGDAGADPRGEPVPTRLTTAARLQSEPGIPHLQTPQSGPRSLDGRQAFEPASGMGSAVMNARDEGQSSMQTAGQRSQQSDQPSMPGSTSEHGQGRFRVDDVLLRNPARPAPISDATRDILRAAATPVPHVKSGAPRPMTGAAPAATQVDRLLEMAEARIAQTTNRSHTPAVARADQLNASLRAGQFNANVEHHSAESTSTGQAAAVVDPTLPGSGEARMTGPLTGRGGAQQLPGSVGDSALSADRQAEPSTLPGVRKGLAVLANQKGGTLTMRLDPPSLGPLRLEMAVDAGRVRVQMLAGSESARALLGSNLGMLRTALEDRGLAVERLVVETTNTTTTSDSASRGESRDQGGQDARNEGRGQAEQDASQGRSRGRRDRGEAGGRAEPGKDSPERFDQVLQDA